MKNGKILFGVLFVGLVGAIILSASQLRTVGKLRAENEALLAEIGDLKARAPEVAKAPDPALAEELEKQKGELLRLRNEVAQFRANRDAAKVNDEPRDRSQSGPRQALSPMTALVEGQSIASADWTFMGYETPHAALISGLSAMKSGQLASLLETFTPEERQRFELQMQGKTEAEILQRFEKELGRVSGLRVVGQQDLPNGEVVLDVYMEGAGRLKKYRMAQVNNEWKAAGPINQNFSPAEPQTAVADSGAGGASMMYYMSNPELMKRYFPQMYEMMMKGKREQGAGAESQVQGE